MNIERHKRLKNIVESDKNSLLSFSVVKSVDGSDGNRYVTGYASTDIIDWVGDKISKDALIDAKDHLLEPGTNTVFYNHDVDQPIGKVVSTSIDDKGLKVKALFSKASDLDNMWTKVKEGIISNFSVRFRVLKGATVNDDNGNFKYYEILKMRLFEVSLVGLPCCQTANVTDVVGKKLSDLDMVSKGKVENKKVKKMKNAEINKKEITENAKSDDIKVIVKDLLSDMIPDIVKKLVTVDKADEKKLDEKIEGKKEETQNQQKSQVTLDEIKNMLFDLGIAKKKEEIETNRKSIEETKEEKADENFIPTASQLKSAIDKKETNGKVVDFATKAMDDEAVYETLDAVSKSYVKRLYIATAVANM